MFIIIIAGDNFILPPEKIKKSGLRTNSIRLTLKQNKRQKILNEKI